MLEGSDEELLIALANTAHGERDELTDAETVRAWWRSLTATRSDDPAATENVALLRSLRGLIRDLALRNNGIEPRPDRTPDLGRLSLRVDVGPALSLRADRPGDIARDNAAAPDGALLRGSARPAWPRLKACRGDDCRWVFIDNSRNRSRRWCAMAECGNRAKVAAFRDRRRTPSRAS